MAPASLATLSAEVDGSAAEHATAGPPADRVHDALKLLAAVAMTIDHAGMVLLDHDSELFAAAKLAGRIAWPIFAVLMGTALARAQATGRMPALARGDVLQLTAWGILAWPFSMAALGSPQPNILLGLAGTVGLVWLTQVCENGSSIRARATRSLPCSSPASRWCSPDSPRSPTTAWRHR